MKPILPKQKRSIQPAVLLWLFLALKIVTFIAGTLIQDHKVKHMFFMVSMFMTIGIVIAIVLLVIEFGRSYFK